MSYENKLDQQFPIALITSPIEHTDKKTAESYDGTHQSTEVMQKIACANRLQYAQQMGNVAGLSVFGAGVGGGWECLALLAGGVGYLWATDVDIRFVQQTRAKLFEAGANPEIHRLGVVNLGEIESAAALEPLGVEPGGVDIVTFWGGVINYIPEDLLFTAFNNVYDMLSPGGKVVLQFVTNTNIAYTHESAKNIKYKPGRIAEHRVLNASTGEGVTILPTGGGKEIPATYYKVQQVIDILANSCLIVDSQSLKGTGRLVPLFPHDSEADSALEEFIELVFALDPFVASRIPGNASRKEVLEIVDKADWQSRDDPAKLLEYVYLSLSAKKST